MISIIIPILNEAPGMPSLMEHLKCFLGNAEIIIVDGGSSDQSVHLIGQMRPHIQVIRSAMGRAMQMNAGAKVATTNTLVFLHSDCRLPENAPALIAEVLQDSRVVGGGFYKRYAKENWLLASYRVLTNLIRVRLLRNFVGTNAIFIRKPIFDECGGYDEVPFLEDVLMSDRMKKAGRVRAILPHVVCSARRYYEKGIVRSLYHIVKILFLFRFMKMHPSELKTIYANTGIKRRLSKSEGVQE